MLLSVVCINFVSLDILHMGPQGTGAYPTNYRVEAGLHPGQAASSSMPCDNPP